MNLATIVYFLAVLIGLFFIWKYKKGAVILYLYAASLPFFGLMYDIGLQINIDRVFVGIMLISLLISKTRGAIPIYIYFFLFYAIVNTILLSQFLPDTAKEYPPLRGEYRWIFQLIMWSLLIVPAIFIPKLEKSISIIINVYKILIYSVAVLCILGIFQLASYYIFGYDPFPVGILQEGYQRFGIVGYGGLSIFRISSLGGEPKNLAYSIAIVLPLLIGIYILKIAKIKFFLPIMILMLITLFFTFSTQGYLLFITNIFLLLLIIFYKKGLIRRLVLLITIAFILSIGIIVKFAIVSELITLRTIERFREVGFIEDWNEAVLGFIKDYPSWLLTGVGLGNIHLYAQSYIPEYAYHYMSGNVFVAKSGLLRIISELGIIGLIIFILMSLYPIIKTWRYVKVDNLILLQIVFFTYTLLSFMLSDDGPNYIFLAMGFQYLLLNILKREKMNFSGISNKTGS